MNVCPRIHSGVSFRAPQLRAPLVARSEPRSLTWLQAILVVREPPNSFGRVFHRLSARQQEVFALRQLEGWSTDEVAETLGLSSGSVKRHLFRATHQLRAALKGTP